VKKHFLLFQDIQLFGYIMDVHCAVAEAVLTQNSFLHRKKRRNDVQRASLLTPVCLQSKSQGSPQENLTEELELNHWETYIWHLQARMRAAFIRGSRSRVHGDLGVKNFCHFFSQYFSEDSLLYKQCRPLVLNVADLLTT
jgi:hypothetical protein